MFELFSLYYGEGIGPGYLFMLAGIMYATMLPFRFGYMFHKYVKTGTLKHGEYDDFMTNFGDLGTEWKQRLTKLFRDLYCNTDPDDLPLDLMGSMLAWLVIVMLGGLLPYLFAVWLIVYGVIRLARHMRRRVEMKEEFIARLKGER